MPFVAPWLNVTPQTWLGAMESGSAAGTRQRAQAFAESEAADRLRLAYDSLASHERMQNEQVQSKVEQAQAAMALRESQMQSLQDYREQQIAQKQNELGLRQQLGESGLALRQQGLDQGAQRIQDLMAQNAERNRLSQENTDLRRSSIEATQARLSAAADRKLSPADDDMVKSINKDIEEERKLSLASNKKDDVRHHEGNIDYLTKMKQGILQKASAGASLMAPSAPGALGDQSVPFKEGQKIRNKKDGKIYVIVNGEPAPVEGETEKGTDEE
jgi:hypothetical protein